MSRLRVIVMGWIIRGPSGGMAWHYLNYVGSLLELGHDAYYIEDSSGRICYYNHFEDGSTDSGPGLAFASAAFDRLGLGDRWAFYDELDHRWKGARAGDAAELCRSADLVLNVSGTNFLRDWFDPVPARVYIDTDPGFTQIRNLTDPAARKLCEAHTGFFSFGENIGRDGCSVPVDGFPWQPTRQPIWLGAWPYSSQRPADRFTTVMQWESYEPQRYGDLQLRMKSASFERFIELPQRVGSTFEAAIGRRFPRQRLAGFGWSLPEIGPILRDPFSYRRFIQQSGGEIGIAKEGYVVTNCGWFSERSAAYLASGRPVLHQNTGFAAQIPVGAGLFAVDGVDDAVDSVHAVQRDYDRHSRAAREVAEAYFAPRQVLPALIEQAGASGGGSSNAKAEPQARLPATSEAAVMPAISAVLCTYMRYDLLKLAVDSLQRQTLDPSRYEILIVDNSPNPELSERAALDYAGIGNLRWIREEKNGESHARNAALAHVNSPIVAYLDDDAVACPEWLEAMLAGFATGDDVAAVGGKVNPIWGAPRPAWLHDQLLELLSVIDWGRRLRPIRPGEWLVAANLALRVAPVKALGGFATHLGRRAGERVLLSNCEMDVIEALRREGYQALYSPAAAVDHLIHPQRLSQTWMRRRVVWQAISDLLKNVDEHLADARDVQRRLAALLRSDPSNGSLTGPTNDSWRFAEQMEALKHLTHALLTGFDADDTGDSGEAAEEDVCFRVTTEDLLGDALRHRQPAAPQTPSAAEGGDVQWATSEPDGAAEEALSRLDEFPVPNHVLAPKGMLIPGEIRLLYRLARHYYSGGGAIIDAGAFCGASAYALAAGVADNPRNLPRHRLVHAYDAFLARDEYTRQYLENNFYSRFDANGERVERIRAVTRGESFFELFAFQTQRYESLIEVHHGSIMECSWPGHPIEILFIDICETLETQNQIMREFLPRLMPGKSILIQQDFHHPWHPYIHVVMEYLEPYFDIVISAVGGSRVYRLRRPLPQEVLDKSMRFGFDDEETVDLLHRMVDKAPEGERRTLAAALARQFFLLGDAGRCRDAIAEVTSELDAGGKAYFDGLFANLCPGIHEPAAGAGPAG
jgi:GT2 family glycosyltransferase